ncbi:hypothetical protein AAF712_009419 [Marasmius tenuissimus]|uniref:Uncharacterized protein n=1 Tax=Marasmius tenuissimus TaxID=585030 RepID=A0ABR2ZRH5_9AGAR
MDGWTNRIPYPFVVVIAHWIHAIPIKDPKLWEQLGINFTLRLRSDLISFHGLPASHTGKHLTTSFFHVLNRLNLLKKIGYIMFDNVANNISIVAELETKFLDECVPTAFTADQNHIRYCLIDFILKCKYTDIKPLVAAELALAEQVKEVPRALSTDKTPTLCDYLPNVHQVITRWTAQQNLYPHLCNAIQQGIDKMQKYQDRVSTVDIYSLALILHPNQKMKWFIKHNS